MTQFDDRNRDQESRAVMEALGRLSAAPPQQPQTWGQQPGSGYQAPPVLAPEGRPIHPLLPVFDLLLAFVLTLLLQIPLIIIYIAATTGFGSLPDTPEGMTQLLATPTVFVASATLQALAFGATVLFRVRLRNGRGASWLGLGPGSLAGKALLWGVIGGVIYLLLNGLSAAAMTALGLAEPDQAAMFPLQDASPVGLALLGIAVVVLAPLNEELFFRGYAQRVFMERLGTWPGIVAAAVLFMLPHLITISQGFAALGVGIFIAGLVLGWIYLRTGSLWSCIIAHAINNGVAFLGLIVVSQAPA